MSEEKKLAGLAGMFDTPDDLIAAAKQVRDANYKKWDCHTPYPVHGLDDAMGLSPSPVPIITILMGFIGIGAALLMQGWMSAIDYPVRIGGKPFWSWPAFVPITFEVFVLFAALATMASIGVFCKLGSFSSPLYEAGVMEEVTSSRFAVVLEAADENFTEEKAKQLLEKAGCKDIRPLYEEHDPEGGII